MWPVRRSTRLDYNVGLTARVILDDRLKERLTGAVILVAIVVLLVPEMFRGSAAPGTGTLVEPAASPAESIAPARTFTLDSSPVPSTTAAATPLPEAVTPPAQAGALPAAQAPAPQVTAPPVVMAPIHPPSAPAATPAAPAVAKPPAIAAKPPATAARPTATAGKGWVVQVGSFSVRENAERMVKQGAKVGLKLQVAGPDDKGYYRVRSAVVRDRAAALKLQARYKELGFKSLLNSAP
jgi:DedD protein